MSEMDVPSVSELGHCHFALFDPLPKARPGSVLIPPLGLFPTGLELGSDVPEMRQRTPTTVLVCNLAGLGHRCRQELGEVQGVDRFEERSKESVLNAPSPLHLGGGSVIRLSNFDPINLGLARVLNR